MPFTLKEKLSQKIVVLGLAVLVAFFGYIRYQQYRQRQSIDAEKASLQTQIDGLEKKNQEMEASIKYLSSLSSKEKVAREQLNLKKQGEVVYGFTEMDAPANGQTGLAAGEQASNPVKWWRYFTE